MDFIWDSAKTCKLDFNNCTYFSHLWIVICCNSSRGKKKSGFHRIESLFIFCSSLLYSLSRRCNDCCFNGECSVVNPLFICKSWGIYAPFWLIHFGEQVAKNVNFGVEKIFDRKALYKNIEVAVTTLSKKSYRSIDHL